MPDADDLPAEAGGPRALRILMVEDDADAMATTLDILRSIGHWATGVSSAESAMARYLPGAFDLLMLDVNLPGLSGMDLAAKLLATHSIPVLFVSGEPEPAEHPHGDAVWLRKPYAIDELERALSRLSEAAGRGST